MTAFLADARQAVAPERGGKDGLLPPMLVGLTIVDAFALLILLAVALTGVTRGRDSSSSKSAG